MKWGQSGWDCQTCHLRCSNGDEELRGLLAEKAGDSDRMSEKIVQNPFSRIFGAITFQIFCARAAV
jgi:hypothetical protein